MEYARIPRFGIRGVGVTTLSPTEPDLDHGI